MPKPSASTIAPLVVGTAEAQRMGSWGKTELFELIKSGELESFLDGRFRKIVTASIHERIRKKLEEGGGTKKDMSLITAASVQKRIRQKTQDDGDAAL